jgi:hypothetical protein
MRLGRLVGATVVLVPLLLVCAARLHAQRGASPHGVTQEVNRCLTVMRVASSRRRTAREREKLCSSVASDAAGAFGRPRVRAKIA